MNNIEEEAIYSQDQISEQDVSNQVLRENIQNLEVGNNDLRKSLDNTSEFLAPLNLCINQLKKGQELEQKEYGLLAEALKDEMSKVERENITRLHS